MQIPKPTEADKEYFRSLVPDGGAVKVKPMFGNLGAFVHGNMFAGLFGPAVGVKLAQVDRDELLGIRGSGPFGPQERPMGGYVAMPAAWRERPELASAWVTRALAYVEVMPPKAGKTTKTGKKSKSPEGKAG